MDADRIRVSVHRFAKSRFGIGLVALSSLAAVAWLVLWAAAVPLVRGWSPVAVLSGSMAPKIESGDVVLAAPYHGESLDPGDVIVFDHPGGTGTMIHRVVDTTPTGDYVTRGDANGRIDSAPVSPDAIHGVGHVLVPTVAHPFVWVDHGQWPRLLIAMVVLVAALWAARWAVLTRYNPWRRPRSKPIRYSIDTIGAILGIWPTIKPPSTATATTSSKAPRSAATRARGRFSGTTVVAGMALSFVIVAPTVIRAQAAFINAPYNDGNSITADTLSSPTGLTATNGATTTVNWTASIDTYASGHRIYRSTVPGGPYVQIAQVTPRSVTTYVDSPPPGIYHYVARAYATNWESSNSNEDGAIVTAGGSADAGGPYTITEGDMVVFDGSASTGPPVSWNWDLDNDGQYDDASGVNPAVPWATLAALGVDDDGVYPIGLEIDGGADTDVTSLTIDNLTPVLSTTGAVSASGGGIYTLNLAAIDPGDDTITSWTINWGDGTVDVIAGDPASATHTYTRVGFTFDILASASDEDGTYLQNELLVPSYDGDKVFRFEKTTGAFLQQFVTADDPIEAHIGPDGRLYVSGELSDSVLRYNAETGAFIDEFVAAGSGGLSEAEGLASGSDGHLYVSDANGNRVLRFNGTTGAFIDVFTSGLTDPYNLIFGPDSNLYVNSYTDHDVTRLDGTTGAFIDVFVTAGSGGLDTPEQMSFGPDGNLYIASFATDEVLRYNGTTGAFIDVFVASGGAGDLDQPTGLAFGPDGNLYVGDHQDHLVLRYHGASGAFIDQYVAPGSGGLTKPDPMTFLPKQQVTITP